MNRKQLSTLLLIVVIFSLTPGLVSGTNADPFSLKFNVQNLDEGVNRLATLDMSRVLFLRLDEPAGAATFSDVSAYNNHGACSGASCPKAGVDGRVDTALHFDGVDDYVSLGNPASLNFAGEITIEAWVNAYSNAGIHNIVAHGYTNTPDAEVLLRIKDGEYQIGSWNGEGHAASYPIPTEDAGRWVHLAGVYDGVAWRLYRDGIEVSFSVDPIGAITVNGDWAVGARGTGTERFFHGLIDQVVIYNRALTAQEIADHYDKAPLGKVYLPLIARSGHNVLLLHLDEPAGSVTFSDASAYNNHGACSGASCPNAGASGRVNTALHFDGVDDYVSLGNPASLNFAGEITIEAWINVQATDGYRNIVVHGYTVEPPREVLLRVANGTYQVGSWDGSGHATSYPIPASDVGRWVHLAGVYDGRAWRLYRNGIEVSVTDDPVGAVAVNAAWAIGATATGIERFFHGYVDEVAIYNQALSAEEIADHFSEASVANQVVPIDWEGFDSTPPQNADLDQARTMLLNSTRYNTAWIEQTFVEDPHRKMYIVTDADEGTIRPAASAVYGLSTSLKSGDFDPGVVGVAEETVRLRAVKLIKGVAAAHRVNSSEGEAWGDQWQSALWAALLGQAGWMLWDDLDSEAQHLVASVVEYEADRFIKPGYQVPYWNGEGGDSKAEENAWNAMLLQVAVAMMPAAPQSLQWKTVCSELMVSAFARESDMYNNVLVLDGQSVQEWLNGYNLRQDGVVVNHDRVHNDYMSTITLNMHAILSQSLAGRSAPETAPFDFDVVYRALATLHFPSPPYEAPGGTMYIPGSPEQYYPEGTDWSRYRFDIFYLLDLYARVFGYDSDLTHKAGQWMRLRAQRLLEMQSRHVDGRVYAPGEFDSYPGREQLAIWQLADAYLLLWLDGQDALSETANWLAAKCSKEQDE